MPSETVHCPWQAQCPCSPQECPDCGCNPANQELKADEAATDSTQNISQNDDSRSNTTLIPNMKG